MADSPQDAARASVWCTTSQQETDHLCSSFHIIGIYEREKCARCLQPLVPDFCRSSRAKRRKYFSSLLGMLTIKRMMYYPWAPGLRCEYRYCHLAETAGVERRHAAFIELAEGIYSMKDIQYVLHPVW